MNLELILYIRKMLEMRKDPEEIKAKLLQRGFLIQDIEHATEKARLGIQPIDEPSVIEPFIVIEESGSKIENLEVKGFDQSANAAAFILPPLAVPPDDPKWLFLTKEQWNFVIKRFSRLTLIAFLIGNAIRLFIYGYFPSK